MSSRAAILLGFLVAVFVAQGCRTATRGGTQHLPRDSFLFINNHIVFKACLTTEGDEVCTAVGEGRFTGSGFVVASRGSSTWGITAGHLCTHDVPDGARIVDSATGQAMTPKIKATMRVIWLGGRWVEAEIEEVIPELDLCVIRLDNVRARQVIQVASKPPVHGDRIYVLSAPLGTFDDRGMLLTFEGHYSGRTSDIPPPSALGLNGSPMIFDAYTVPSKGGSSGSPIMNAEGELVGVTSVALRNFENLALSPSYEGVAGVVRRVQARAYERAK